MQPFWASPDSEPIPGAYLVAAMPTRVEKSESWRRWTAFLEGTTKQVATARRQLQLHVDVVDWHIEVLGSATVLITTTNRHKYDGMRKSIEKVMGTAVPFCLKTGHPPRGEQDVVTVSNTGTTRFATVSKLAMTPGAFVVKALHLWDNLSACDGVQAARSPVVKLGDLLGKGPFGQVYTTTYKDIKSAVEIFRGSGSIGFWNASQELSVISAMPLHPNVIWLVDVLVTRELTQIIYPLFTHSLHR